MIVALDQARRLLRGKSETVLVKGCSRYRTGRSYVLSVREPPDEDGKPGKVRRGSLRVVVLGVAPHRAADEAEVLVRLEHEQRPRYLHRQPAHNYTYHQAEAVPDEPEAVDEAGLAKIVSDAHARWMVYMRERDAARERDLTPGERLDRTLRAAKAKGVNSSPHIRVVMRRIVELERRLSNEP